VALGLAWAARKEAAGGRAREEAQRLATNRRVYGWGNADGQRGYFEWAAFVQNATGFPLHGVAVNVLSDPRLGFSGFTTSIHTLAPGQTFPLSGRTPWSGAISNPPCYVVVTFRDADGVLCQRHPDGSLSIGAAESVRFPKGLDE
jgi:hypothetical protein